MTVEIHKHNGIDSNQLEAKEALAKCPQTAVTKPTGGSVIDVESRAAINDIINKLKAIGITL